MAVNVKRSLLIMTGFKAALEKIYPQDMKLKDREALKKLIKVYEPELKDTLEMISKYQGSEDGKTQLLDYLNSFVELPCLPKNLLQDENLKISTQDTIFLENVVE